MYLARCCSQRERPRRLRLRASAKGTSPLGFPSFGGGGGDGRLRPSPYLTGTPRRDDRPPTHFFVKKKFSPIGGVETATQKVSSVFCRARTLCGARSLPHAGGSFFLYEKSVLRESDSLRGRRKEVCTDLTPPLFPPLKKPLKITGSKGI